MSKGATHAQAPVVEAPLHQIDEVTRCQRRCVPVDDGRQLEFVVQLPFDVELAAGTLQLEFDGGAALEPRQLRRVRPAAGAGGVKVTWHREQGSSGSKKHCARELLRWRGLLVAEGDQLLEL